MKGITLEKLSYLTTRELWVLMKDLGIPYCNIVQDEKENLSTGEKVPVPRFIPRTDFEEMKSEIMERFGKLNREQKRYYTKTIDKIVNSRLKNPKPVEIEEVETVEAEVVDNG